MWRTLSLLALAFALACGQPAAAQLPAGVALRWDHCYGEGSGTMLRAFACGTNAGSEQLVGSFALPAALDQVTGCEIVVNVLTGEPVITLLGSGGPLPAWWEFVNAGSCRRNSLSVSAGVDPDNGTCPDWASGQAAVLLAGYRVLSPDPGLARILIVSGITLGAPASLAGGTEYRVFTIRIDHARTVGDGACGGCEETMTLQLGSVNVVTTGNVNNIYVSGGLDPGGSDFALWRPVPVAVHATSWAALKSRFR